MRAALDAHPAGLATQREDRRPAPRIGSPGYLVLLAAVALFIVGPIAGVTAAYTSFALGAFVPGQVLAGILGSVVTVRYGPEGKHGANYVQTMAASVASMAAMAILVQAMTWLGIPSPPDWALVLYFLCVGMFGVGLGMLYTPLLVDRMKLTYPSGLAVANILRALTDPKILRRSAGTLGGGIGAGGLAAWLADKVPLVAASGFEGATVGSGMIVGARVSVPALVVSVIGLALTPWLRRSGHLGPDEPFRKVGFLFALGMVLGAAILDMAFLARDVLRHVRRTARDGAQPVARPARLGRLGLWVAGWALALLVVASQVLGLPMGWVALAIGLSFVFQLLNGISLGMTDQNPISSAFIVAVLAMACLGLRDPRVGLLAGSVLLVSCTVGVDMQQDRSTGWRLGSSRTTQFRFQVIGIIGGAAFAVLMSRLFLEAFPVLKENQLAHPELRHGAAAKWQSAMTYKFVGVLDTLGEPKDTTLAIMALGLGVGLAIAVVRRVVLGSAAYAAWRRRSRATAVADFVLDSVVLASPYAAAFGGFVAPKTALWWSIGGALSSTLAAIAARAAKTKKQGALPSDMSPTSLLGGGLIAGASLYVMYVGVASLIASGTLGALFGR